MSTYTILQITEPDYGCEETHRAEPTALLKLREEPSDDVRYVEVPERVLAEQGLKEGKKVTFATDGTIRKHVRVVAAVIRDPKEHPGRVFATARGYGEYKGWWEFPGGKNERLLFRLTFSSKTVIIFFKKSQFFRLRRRCRKRQPQRSNLQAN